MIEILVLFFLGKKIAVIAKSKGRSSVAYVLLLIAMWVGGEISGAIVGALTGQDVLPYVFALLGAILGAVLTFFIVNSLAPLNDDDYPLRHRHADDWQDDDYKKRFSPGSAKSDDYTADPNDRPRRADDRYQAE